MSGKYENNNAGKKKSAVAIALIAVVVVAVLAAALFLMNRKDDMMPENAQMTQSAEAEQTQVQTEQTEPVGISLGNGLAVLDIGAYTGIYMEDGTDEIVSDILMMKVTNIGEDNVEYARITMAVGEETAEFTLATLKPGDTVVLLEKSRMAYDSSVDYDSAEIVCQNLALYQEPLRLHEDKLSIQILDGAIYVTNISGKDITGRVSIYYKNKASGIYYGGITYRIVLENGLKDGEIRQMMASHFSETGSEIVFVTIGK